MDMALPPCDIAFSSDPDRRRHDAQFHQGFASWTAHALTASDLSDLGTAISQGLSVVRFLFGIAIPVLQSRRVFRSESARGVARQVTALSLSQSRVGDV